MKTTNTVLLRPRDVVARTGLNRSTIYRMGLAGKFPRPVKLGNLVRVGWVESEVDQWIQDQIKASREPMSKAA